MNYPVEPTLFSDCGFDWDYYERDYFFSPDEIGEIPDHHCKKTWLKSLPYIKNYRNAIDIGCRDGEYTRYLHKHFTHVYCFDYRRRKLFNKNVDVTRITHFKCGLSDENEKMIVSGSGSMTSSRVPKEKWYEEQLYTLDTFDFENIDYIKIDVDGFELKVLKGSVKTLEKYQPLLVIEQLKQENSSIKFCETIGYKILAWDDDHRNVIMGI